MASKRRGRKKSISSIQPRTFSGELKSDDGQPPPADIKTTAPKSNDSRGVAVKKGSDSVDWQGEYRYVVKDLRRLLIVSVALFALIVVIGLVI